MIIRHTSLLVLTMLLLFVIGCGTDEKNAVIETATNVEATAAPTDQPTAVPTNLPPTATPEPESGRWWDDAVFYEIFVRSFYDSDGDGVGDLNGIIEKLDYLEALGVTALWLMPIAESPSYHGYDVVDYRRVDEEYGSKEDWLRLVDELHKRDMRVIVDLVLNHSSSKHPWFEQAIADENSPFRDWYVWNERGGRGWHCRDTGCYYGIFWEGMPDLNYENENVTRMMYGVSRYWLEDMRVDGFRLDAIKHLIEIDGETENTPETRQWFQEYNRFVKSINPEALLIGEVWSSTAASADYVVDGSVDLTFAFEISDNIISSARGNNYNAIAAYDGALREYPDYQFGSFISNHDQNRVVSQLFQDPNRAKPAATMLLTSPGVPFIYYGEEIGMLGKKPDELIRTPLQWSAEPGGGFTTGSPWQALNDDYEEVNIAAQQTDKLSIWNHYQHLISLRHQHPALRSGAWIPVTADDKKVYATIRQLDDTAILTIINLGREPISDYTLRLSGVTLPDEGAWQIAETLLGVDADPLPFVDGQLIDYRPIAELDGMGSYILRLEKQ